MLELKAGCLVHSYLWCRLCAVYHCGQCYTIGDLASIGHHDARFNQNGIPQCAYTYASAHQLGLELPAAGASPCGGEHTSATGTPQRNRGEGRSRPPGCGGAGDSAEGRIKRGGGSATQGRAVGPGACDQENEATRRAAREVQPSASLVGLPRCCPWQHASLYYPICIQHDPCLSPINSGGSRKGPRTKLTAAAA